MPDSRVQELITYDRRFLAWWGICLFLLKLGSRRQLDFDLADSESFVLANVNRLAGTHQDSLPVHNTLRHFIGHVSSRPFRRLCTRILRRLMRMRALDEQRLGSSFVVAVDGTGLFSFDRQHCPYCLTQEHEGKTRYFHPVLEAKLVTSNGLALSLASEFIENPVPVGSTQAQHYQKIKQDCELKAFARLAPQLRRDFPQTLFLITSDALYACGTAIQICKDNRFSYIFTFKPGSLPTVWEDFQALLKLCPQNTKRVVLPDGTVRVYRWVNDLDYLDTYHRAHRFDGFSCQETTPQHKQTLFAWITERHVTADNVVELSQKGGRARSRIENEGFNAQKNSGLNLEHPYGSKDVHWKALYHLLQIGHTLSQLLEKGSLLRHVAARRGKTVRGLFGSLKNISRRLLDCFRYFHIPQQAFDPALAKRIQIRLNSS